MNPDRNRGGMTVNTLMQWGLFLSAAIPVVMIAFLGVFVSQRITTSSDAATFVLVVVACAIVALIGVMTINYFVQREVKSRLLGLVDVCRDYAGGDRTVRATFNGDDEFAMLSMSLNSLLDSQGTLQSGATFSSTGNDAAALQSQIEKLLQEVSAVGDGDLRVQSRSNAGYPRRSGRLVQLYDRGACESRRTRSNHRCTGDERYSSHY